MNLAHLFEAAMLVCFGFSWPLNVIKAYKARTAKGTSLPFIILIITGYLAGISAKIINGQYNYVLVVYFLNLAIVMTNVFVYIRNKALDKKVEAKKSLKITANDIKNVVEKEDTMMNYTYSLDELIHKPAAANEKKNAVILMGGSIDTEIPVSNLAKEFNFNFDIYNKSTAKLSVGNANEYFQKNIAALEPEAVLIHLGESDLQTFKSDSSTFDRNYLALVESIKALNKNCRIALVSVENPSNDKSVNLMNAHIKAIANAEKTSFVNLENAKLWNPEANKTSSAFAYNMGLKIRKPLNDVAEILYSWAFHNIKSNTTEILVG
ncbi:SGNH/GDSL hydrolase family protein [Treponema bryantii]|uniref:SGNH/GDSL hydrolase family protein n=1 Tax=Treponema bryantii TaxID=163 RepID=UPI0003B742B4|nr:hypothetical protein [Treponema bryantii]